ncbi:MAG: hypothetical protein JWN08_1954 [Frankiales bacterium]|jgi:hypothetical protein|nr:hypothetical protein [Frankiales bacterium]
MSYSGAATPDTVASGTAVSSSRSVVATVGRAACYGSPPGGELHRRTGTHDGRHAQGVAAVGTCGGAGQAATFSRSARSSHFFSDAVSGASSEVALSIESGSESLSIVRIVWPYCTRKCPVV